MNFKRLLILTLLTGSCAAQEIAVPQANSFLPEQAAEATREEQTYAEATNLLNSNQWERAAERFNDVAGMKGRRADAGLYWKAYALNKMSRRADALTTISELRRQYPRSTWLKDAGALELEVRQASGQPVNPDKEEDEDIKIYAVNSLMNSDPERALPILQKLLTSNNSVRVKDKALFVLSQSDSPQAAQILASVARGQAHPELQRKAINYLGIGGGSKNGALLAEIYQSASNPDVKREVLNAFLVADAKESLMAVTKTERDPSLRRHAIHQLGAMGATKELQQVLQSSTTSEDKEAIMQAFGIAGDSDDLLQIAKSNADVEVRRSAIRALGITGGNLGSTLVQIASSDPNRDLRRAAMEALFIRGDAHDLVAIAKSTNDVDTRKRAVEKLSLMDSKEARDYMLELLNK